MDAAIFTPKQTRMMEVLGACLLVFVMATALLYQYKGWKLDGSALLVVCILLVNTINVFRSEIGRVSRRIAVLEAKLAAAERGT